MPAALNKRRRRGEDEAELDHDDTEADRDPIQEAPLARPELPRDRRRDARERQQPKAGQ